MLVSILACSFAGSISYGLFSLYGSYKLLPVSTTAVDAIADAEKHKTGEKEITFYRGTNEDNIKLKAGSIKAVNNDATKIDADSGDDKVTVSANPDTYPGYYAIDLFLRNSSRLGQDETIGTAVEIKC